MREITITEDDVEKWLTEEAYLVAKLEIVRQKLKSAKVLAE